jgi:hypothetical protein
MRKKQLKFVSIPDALVLIKNTLLMQSEFKTRQEIEPLLRQFEDFQTRKDIKNSSLDFVSRDGLWRRYQGKEKFFYGIDLVDFFEAAISARFYAT